MNKIFQNIKWLFAALFMLAQMSCINDLNVTPQDDDTFTTENYFKTEGAYKQFLAKIYGGLALTGNSAPAGDSDLQGSVDEGFSQYLRGYWQLQELTTDEAITAWGESDNPGIRDLNFNTWNASNPFNNAFFARIFYQVSLVNEFLRETTDEKLNSRGVSSQLKEDIKKFRAEARFLRALSLYHGIDIYGNMPFATEADEVGNKPVMKSRSEVFDYVVKELSEIEADLAAPRSNEYGRADKGALWMLQAKLFMNAKIYTGQDKSAEALAALNKVITAGYALATKRDNLFLADNDVNGAQSEIIFPIRYDGVKTKTWGGMTYLIHASCDSEVGATLGIDFGWQGFRARKEFYSAVSGDPRVKVVANGDPAEITDYLKFKEGKKLIKFSNLKSTGAKASDQTHPDTDFPMFRLADAYLMYAELAAVNGQGSKTIATRYVNELRQRVGATPITESALNLQFILDERAKELYWEAHRRQDLIRLGKYLTGQNWQWKGGSYNGAALPTYRLLFPIPNKELAANSNLVQNPGY